VFAGLRGLFQGVGLLYDLLKMRQSLNSTFPHFYFHFVACAAGCFKKVFINGRMFDFTSITTQFKVLPGCSDMDLLSTPASTDPCQSHSCRNGRCRAVNETNYVCSCRRGYSGPVCDVGQSAILSDLSTLCVYQIYKFTRFRQRQVMAEIMFSLGFCRSVCVFVHNGVTS